MSKNIAKEVFTHGLELKSYGEGLYHALGIAAFRTVFAGDAGATWQIDRDMDNAGQAFRATSPVRSRLASLENVSRQALGLIPAVGSRIVAGRQGINADEHQFLTSYPPYELVSLYRPRDEAGNKQIVVISGSEVAKTHIDEFMVLKPDDLLSAGYPSTEFVAAEHSRLLGGTEALRKYFAWPSGTHPAYGFRLPEDRFMRITTETIIDAGHKFDMTDIHIVRRGFGQPQEWQNVGHLMATAYDENPSALMGTFYRFGPEGNNVHWGMENHDVSALVSGIVRLSTTPQNASVINPGLDFNTMPVADFDYAFIEY